MQTSIPSREHAGQPERPVHGARSLRRVLLALAIGATLAGGALLARVPVGAPAASAAHLQASGCPATTLICP